MRRPIIQSTMFLLFLAACGGGGDDTGTGASTGADTTGGESTTTAPGTGTEATGTGATGTEATGTTSTGTTSTGTDATSAGSTDAPTTTGSTGDPSTSTTTGPAPVCGDGVADAGEECDDANDLDTDACTNACKAAVCGDAFVHEGVEECDDGNLDDTDACPSTCALASCGDGFIHVGVEECDDGNDVDDDPCSNACVVATCSDKKKNDAETDVDCGGDCEPCADGLACTSDIDCAGGMCVNKICQGPKLMPPNCAPADVNATAAWTMVVMPKCGCHANGSGGLTMNSAATLKSNTVNVDATTALMKRITPGDIDHSYLLYKILGQQNNAPMGGGSQMPLGGMLSDAERCVLINWVKSGAN